MSTLDLKVIGQRLQDARNRSGFTQAQVEKHTGINATQLSDYENGERPLGLGVAANTCGSIWLYSAIFSSRGCRRRRCDTVGFGGGFNG